MNTLSSLLGQGGGNWPLWSPTRIVLQDQIVRSPLDHELYSRTSATGSSATDPADDIVNYKAESYKRWTAIVCDAELRNPAGSFAIGTKKISTPVVAVNVRTLVLEMIGRGVVDFMAVMRGGSGPMRTELVIDGRTVYDDTKTWSGAVQWSIFLGNASMSGSGQLDTPIDAGTPIEFKRHLRLYMTPSTSSFSGPGQIAYKQRSQA
ncbi:hypothetical protein INR38_17845 [Delftia sp. SD018]|uniref:hypothetical protein n=1 Tax=unclassified Delftia TaxID=2613839 RepID=UPI001A972ECB|nr:MULTISPECIES: hypothetical protein [unclassified Delftia]MBO0990974.1 hypothetical protein [Delftia sp. SD083]MBO1035942.1 hypothetical protein [Delftia sp. SD018]